MPRTDFRSLPKEAPQKIWLSSGKRFQKIRCLSIVDDDDGRTTDHGYPISSPMSLWLKRFFILFIEVIAFRKKHYVGVIMFHKHESLVIPPTSKKLRRHIGLGLSVCLSVRPSVSYACIRSNTVRDRILKFGMWDEYENEGDLYFFLVHRIHKLVIAE